MDNNLLLGITIVIFGTFLGAFGALLLKLGSSSIKSRSDLIKITKIYKILIGVFLYGASAIFFTFALKFGDLSILYPIVSLTYIWTALLSIFILNEKINTFRWTGIFFILLGVVVIGLGA